MNKEGPVRENPTCRQIADAVAGGGTGIKLDANPVFASLGAILEEAGEGEIVVSFMAGPETTQGNGVVGGGTLALMLDNAMAIAVMSALGPGRVPTTVSLTANMLKPGLPGRLMVRARVDRLGKTMAFASARLMGEDGALLATGTSSLAVLTL